VTAAAPTCGRVACSDTAKHNHTGALGGGDLVVGVPKTATAGGYLYRNPRGRVIKSEHPYAVVEWEDGTITRCQLANLVRTRLFRPSRQAVNKL
jgi:hypothetical protein